jgi:hypothetical protein
MITLDSVAGMRRGRIFLRDGDEAAAQLIETDPPIEGEDEARYELLYGAFKSGVVHSVAHPGVDIPDVMDVYIAHPETGDPVFACVVVSQNRLKRMLAEAPVVIEDFCLQVANVPRLTTSAIRAALTTWAARIFPPINAPQFNVTIWSDATDDPMMALLAAPLAESIMADDFPTEYDPSATVERPWDEAA